MRYRPIKLKPPRLPKDTDLHCDACGIPLPGPTLHWVWGDECKARIKENLAELIQLREVGEPDA